MFKIGEFSKISNTTVRTLRYYEKLNLLIPAKIDFQSGYRYYEAGQITKINQIKLLQQVGLKLETIKEILEKEQLEIVNSYYEEKESEIDEEMETLVKKKKMIQQLQTQLREGSDIEKYNVLLKVIPARKVASMRKKLLTYQDEGELWENIWKQIQQLGAKAVPASLPVSIYHDEEYREKDVDVEVQIEVAREYEGNREITFFNASEMLTASVTFNGSFEQMPQVTQAIALWLEFNQYQVAGPMVNRSHVSPGQEPDPAKWITETSFVVAPIDCENKKKSLEY
ncbi:MerR family transcriptional regulator [Enterococcus sp. BWB1-3]|uniref:MerR family transcriptional regulator n=1 Tax=unclassified Enterococcus TaxID=2608891 RepID=UPI001920BBA6|nr:MULTISPECIES: MerR family transcriptional regulator [unclassified Enterococcus]MBL1228960.1 MerR family transcriptional regulator [Enterococcus sp. BWB1-3]MCB5952227.1 MerR family transcriptional regulator [Enterococcus sp. BWT-B8]MCB5956373.1 MerR family transcriptional regulator [Enterococcus sp. CWB-B31]